MQRIKIIGISLLSAVFLFVSVSEIRQTIQGKEKVYTVQEGKHNFKPDGLPLPYFGVNTYEFSARFDSSQWWSIEDEDYHGGKDIFDWNKLGGMTNYLSASNRQSVLVGWRPDTAYMVMQITPYVNDKKGGFETGPVWLVPVDSFFTGRIKWYGSVAHYFYEAKVASLPSKKPFIVRTVGPWFGGNKAAHKEIKIQLATNIK